jgi:hypothetical protein
MARINPDLQMVDGGSAIPLTAAEVRGMNYAAQAKAAADKAAKDAAQAEEDAYYTKKVGNTGKTQAQLDALENAKKTASQITESYGSIGITSTVDPKTGMVVTTNNIAGKREADAAAKAAADAAAAAARKQQKTKLPQKQLL